MPLNILSVSAFVCDRILIEKDDVCSAIRIVDVHYVPPDVPQGAALEITLFMVIKTLNPGEAPLTLKLLTPDGSERIMKGLDKIVVEKSKFPDDPNIPIGSTVGLRMAIEPRPLGTYTIKVEIEGAERAQVYFTLRASEKQS